MQGSWWRAFAVRDEWPAMEGPRGVTPATRYATRNVAGRRRKVVRLRVVRNLPSVLPSKHLDYFPHLTLKELTKSKSP